MKIRKIVLLTADVLLLLILILQLCLKSGDKTKEFKLSEQPDELIFSSPSDSYTLINENDSWFVGAKKYPANKSYSNQYADAAMSIKVLDKVASAANTATLEKYELTEDQRITVVAKKDGKVVRTIMIGKSANAGSQCYIMIDDSKDIYLSAGNVRNDFNKSISYLRSKIVVDMEDTQITSATITDASGSSWSISRMGSGDDVVWNSSNPVYQIDGKKAGDWLDSLDLITTGTWYSEDAVLEGQKILAAVIGAGFKNVTYEIYKMPLADTEGATQKYWAKCTESPYPFDLAAYAVERFQKDLSEFVK